MNRTKKSKPTTLKIGSVSTGTLLAQDVLSAYLDACDKIRLSRAERKIANDAADTLEEADGDPSLDYDEMVEEVARILEVHVPDFCYFGAHPGDGADFGCWPDWDAINEAESGLGATLIRKEDMPPGGVDLDRRFEYWLQVNDHGNATLYRRAGNRWLEVWSVV